MLSTSIIRNRDHIDAEIISSLQKSIQNIIDNYKQAHASFFEEFKYGATFTILGELEAEIQTLVQNKNKKNTAFEQFSKILQKIYSKFQFLDAEKEIDLIRKFQRLLVEQVSIQAEADWEQMRRDYHMKSRDMDGRLDYSLKTLCKAASVTSAHQELFNDKWKVYEGHEEYGVWMYLLENFKLQVDDGCVLRLLSELRIRFGLGKTSLGLGVDVNNPIYGPNVTNRNKYSYIFVLPANAVVPNREQRFTDVLYLKKRENHAVEVYLHGEEYPRMMNDKESKALAAAEIGLKFNTNEVMKITDNTTVAKVVSTCALDLGCFDKIVKSAKAEIFELEKTHQCINFSPEQKKIVEMLNPRTGSAFIKAQLLVKNKEKFGKSIQQQLDQIGELDTELEQYQLEIFQQVREQLTLRLRVSELRHLIEEIKKPILGGEGNKHVLIKAIMADNSLFSFEMQAQVDAFAEQLKIWNLENLITVCKEYLQYYIISRCNNLSLRSFGDPVKFLFEKFIQPVVEELINPLLYILHKPSLDLNSKSIKQDLQTIYAELLKAEAKKSYSSEETAMSESQSQEDDGLKSSEKYQPLAMKAISLVYKAVNRTKLEAIKQNNSLLVALAASVTYYNTSNGNTHGIHGKEMTILLIKKLLNMHDPSHINIQNEILNYINGKGDYSAWYGGASGYHKHSRLAPFLDLGLFDDRKEEMFPFKTSTAAGYFNHLHLFHALDENKRKDLSVRLSSLTRRM